MYLPYFGQDLESKKKVVGILAHVWLRAGLFALSQLKLLGSAYAITQEVCIYRPQDFVRFQYLLTRSFGQGQVKPALKNQI